MNLNIIACLEKGIVSKVRLVCTVWYKHMLVFISGCTSKACFKNDTFILILKHFLNKLQKCDQNDVCFKLKRSNGLWGQISDMYTGLMAKLWPQKSSRLLNRSYGILFFSWLVVTKGTIWHQFYKPGFKKLVHLWPISRKQKHVTKFVLLNLFPFNLRNNLVYYLTSFEHFL